MKATGVVRRIDELGRIVIPKEIRKTLRIKDGESLEIYVNEDSEIILKKYSVLNKIDDFAQDFVDSIYSFLKHNIIVTDTDSVLAVAGNLKKEYLNKEISSNLEHSIKRRECMLETHMKDLKLIEDKNIECTYAISTIVVNGDTVGAVIILSTDEKVSEADEKIVKIASQFLSKYLEE